MLRISQGHILWSTVRLCHIFWCQSESKPFSKRGPKAMHPIMRLRGHQFHKRATSAMLTIDKDKRSPLPAYATQNFIGADFHNGQAFIFQSHNNDDKRSHVHNLWSPFDGFHNSRDQIGIFKEEWPLDQVTLAKACRKTSKVRWEFFSRKDHAAARGEQADIEQLQHPNVELEEWQFHSNLLWSGWDWGTCNIQDLDHVGTTSLRMDTLSGISHVGSLIWKRQRSG